MQIVLRVAAASLALSLASAGVAQTVRSGIDAWQRSDYAAAVKIWRPLAEKGDADAAFNLGQAFRLGRGVPVDLAAAQTWLERAARSGHVDAQATLGLFLFDSGNRTGGLRWLRSAAEQGEPRALLVYGTALFNGDGVKADPQLAYAYISRAAAQGLAPAKSTLAELDAVLPIETRQRGVALALEKARAGKPQPRTVKAIAKDPSSPSAKSPPKAPAATSGGWRIQLGAFSKPAAAQALFRKLSSAPPVSGKQAYVVPAGSVTRLQVGPFPTKAAAASACAILSARGQPCFAVPAR